MNTDGRSHTPTRLNISQAAKAARISRSTINKHIKDGRISIGRDKSGQPFIDMSELVRVYDDVDTETVSDIVDNGQSHTPKKDTSDSALHVEIQMLRERLADKDSVIDDLRGRLDEESAERRKLTAMLTDQRPSPSPESPQEPSGGRLGRAWSILRGKA